MAAGGKTFLVTTRPDWDGYYHEPCQAAEREILAAGPRVATSQRAMRART